MQREGVFFFQKIHIFIHFLIQSFYPTKSDSAWQKEILHIILNFVHLLECTIRLASGFEVQIKL